MKVKQHFPSSFEGWVPIETEVDSLYGLMCLPFIAHWVTEPSFYRFSCQRHYQGDMHLLLAELKGGRSWYVVAYLDGNLDILEPIANFEPPHDIVPAQERA